MSPRGRRPRRAVRPGDAEQRRERGDTAPARHPGVLPDRAAEDTAAAWGERDEGDDERLRREVPPHW